MVNQLGEIQPIGETCTAIGALRLQAAKYYSRTKVALTRFETSV